MTKTCTDAKFIIFISKEKKWSHIKVDGKKRGWRYRVWLTQGDVQKSQSWRHTKRLDAIFQAKKKSSLRTVCKLDTVTQYNDNYCHRSWSRNEGVPYQPIQFKQIQRKDERRTIRVYPLFRAADSALPQCLWIWGLHKRWSDRTKILILAFKRHLQCVLQEWFIEVNGWEYIPSPTTTSFF